VRAEHLDPRVVRRGVQPDEHRLLEHRPAGAARSRPHLDLDVLHPPLEHALARGDVAAVPGAPDLQGLVDQPTPQVVDRPAQVGESPLERF
jgi:hypothetical protein